MKQNPNLISNFGNNMVDSGKVTYHQESVRKEFLKYAGGGLGYPEKMDEHRQMGFDRLPGIKPIKTEQSGVS